MAKEKELSRKEVIERLKTAGIDVATAIDSLKNPNVKLPLRALSNVYFDATDKLIKLGDKQQTRSFFNVNQAKKFMQTMLVAAQIKELAQQGMEIGSHGSSHRALPLLKTEDLEL